MNVLPVVMVISVASVAVVVSLYRWHYVVYGLLFYVTIAGAVQLLLPTVRWAVLFTDLVFVIPCYLGLSAAWMRPRRARPRVPASLMTAVLFLVVNVCIQMFNPAGPVWLARLVGLKIWLFYLPMMAVGSAFAVSRQRIAGLLRVFLVLLWLPCSIGLLQWSLSLAIGYENAIRLFYADGAAAATQGFTSFEVGAGRVMRIPSSFSFPAQYYNYLLCATMVAWAATHGERSRGWARFAWISLILTVLASVFSGVRAAFVFAPLLLLLAHLFKKDAGRLTGLAVAATLLVGLGLSLANLNWLDLGDFILGLAVTYAGTNSIEYIAASASTFGWGVGSGTNAARYVLDLPTGQGQGPENYYAKAIYELGVPGLMAVLLLLLVTIWVGIAQLRRLRNSDTRALYAGVLALEVTVAVYCFKGNFLDMDPLNVLFWFFVGVALRLPKIDKTEPATERWDSAVTV